MKLFVSILCGTLGAPGNHTLPPSVPFQGDDIRWTPDQIEWFQNKGVDTTGWQLTPGSEDGHSKAVIDPDHSYHWRWTNPAGFDGPHLRVPIRMQEGAFSESVWTKIVGDMKKMSDYVGGCIEFYDDTVQGF